MSYFYWMAILGLAICLSIVVSVAKDLNKKGTRQGCLSFCRNPERGRAYSVASFITAG